MNSVNLKINEFEILDIQIYLITIRFRVKSDSLLEHFDFVIVDVDFSEFSVCGPTGERYYIYRMCNMPSNRWPYYEKLAYELVKPYQDMLRGISRSSRKDYLGKAFPPTENAKIIQTLAKLL